MAADQRPFFLFRPRFVMFCLYVAAYCFLRHTGEMAVQTVFLPGGGSSFVHRVVGPHPDLPHYRQQLWRALFSLPMVAEEEGRRLSEQGRGLYESAQEMIR